jgi:hypothetical protein
MPEYKKALVTYIDILGFSDLIKQSGSDSHCNSVAVDKILRIVSKLKRANDFTGRINVDEEGKKDCKFFFQQLFGLPGQINVDQQPR